MVYMLAWPVLAASLLSCLPSATGLLKPTKSSSGAPWEATAKQLDPFKSIYGHIKGEATNRSTWQPMIGPRGDGQWTDRILIWPESKFAFCWIDKNAGTQFNLLMNKLNDVPLVWFQSSMYSGKVPHKGIDNGTISRRNGWRMGIFLRDPAERFLSSWASKCQGWEDQGKNCLGDHKVAASPVEDGVPDFEAAVRTYLPQYMDEISSRRKKNWNAHYDPQSHFCGARRADAYDFVGELSNDASRVHKQVVHMFQDVAHVPQDKPEFWELVERMFPGQESEVKAGHTMNTKAKMALYYRDPEVYRAVVRAYREDYERFGMSPNKTMLAE